jgi:putative peptidoglycan lipid II flippase
MTSARTLLGRSSLIAIGALSSRVTGFVRTAAIGAALGAGLVGDAYTTAVMLPGIVYEILLGGIGTAVLVPLLNQAKADQDGGREFAQRLISFATLAFGIAALAATAAMPLLIPLLGGTATAGESADLTTAFSMFTVPALLFYGIGSVATAILNARGAFALPAWSPACNNLTLIVVALLLIAFPANDFDDFRVLLVGGATLLGAALQAAVLIPALRKAGVPWKWRPSLRGFGLRRLSKTILWVTAYVAAGQVGLVVIIGLVRAAAAHGGPGPLIYNNAWVLLMMAYGVLALPVITALAPDLSEDAAQAEAKTASRFRTGLRVLVMITLPAVAAMIVLGEPIAIVLFQWGEYTHADAVATGTVIAAAGLALIPYAVSQLQFFAFLAIGDARTPAVIMMWSTAARVALCVAAYAVVPADYVAASVMAVNAVTSVLMVALAAPVLRRKLGEYEVSASKYLRPIGSAVVTAVVGFGIWWATGTLVHDPKTASFLTLGLFSPVLVAAFIPTIKAFRKDRAKSLREGTRRPPGGRLGAYSGSSADLILRLMSRLSALRARRCSSGRSSPVSFSTAEATMSTSVASVLAILSPGTDSVASREVSALIRSACVPWNPDGLGL